MSLSSFSQSLRETAELLGSDQKALKARLLSGSTAIDFLSRALTTVLPIAEAAVKDHPELRSYLMSVEYAKDVLACYGSTECVSPGLPKGSVLEGTEAPQLKHPTADLARIGGESEDSEEGPSLKRWQAPDFCKELL